MRDNRASEPTRRIASRELREYARQLEARLKAGRPLDADACTKLAQDAGLLASEHDVDIEVEQDPVPSDRTPPASRLVLPGTVAPDDPWLACVPVIMAATEDLEWFTIDADALAVLGLVDGEAPMEAILARTKIPRDRAIGLLKELEAHQVIATKSQ